MKGRLFWKTLVGFWLTFWVISWCVAVVFRALHYQPSLSDEEVAHRISPPMLEICAAAVARAGPDACLADIRRLAPDDLERIEIRPVEAAGGARQRGRLGARLTRQTAAPDGRRFELSYRYTPPPPYPQTIFHVPFEVMLLGGVGGLTFSAILAWYVIAPIRRVRRGFEALADGRLSTRVGHTVGKRSDELADLARDFDRMAARLEDLVATRDRLLHDVSHEFRSPLSRLQLSIALARQDNSRLPTSLSRIEREARRLDNLVNELLTLARAESGIGASDEYFDLGGVVRSVISDAKFEAAATEVAIAARLPKASDDLPTVRGSSELIRRAVDNVVRNAIKFSPAGAKVAVGLRFDEAGRAYVLEVADSGPGVAEPALPRLFDPFVKADDRRAGFGLGLSIAHRAVEAHGGRIAAANRPEGGLLVTLILPAHLAVAGES